MDESKKLEIERILIRTKENFYTIFEVINSLSHEDNKREFNRQASRIFNDFQTLQSYVSSR